MGTETEPLNDPPIMMSDSVRENLRRLALTVDEARDALDRVSRIAWGLLDADEFEEFDDLDDDLDDVFEDPRDEYEYDRSEDPGPGDPGSGSGDA